MRSIKEENLYTIGQDFIEKAVKGGNINNSVFEYSEIKEAVLRAFEEKEARLVVMSQNIDIARLKKFLRTPQINNIAVSYIRYTTCFRVACLIDKEFKELEKKIFLGDVINYFLQVISKNFPTIPENEVVTIKAFIEIL